MEIKQDERALLQLLLERGQSYADIAGLLGQSEAEVRERARSLLARLGGADPDAEVGLSDYLLGQADPIGRADVVRHLQRDERARELAEEIATKLAAIAPAAELPDLDSGRAPRRRPGSPSPAGADTAPASRPRPVGSGLDRRQQRILALLATGGLILLVIILAVAGAFSGDDEDASGTDAAGEVGITEVQLRSQGGSSATGAAVFGQTEDDFPYVDLNVTGLPATGEDDAYFLWILFVRDGDEVGIPLSTVRVDRNGNLNDRLAFPVEAIPFAALATHIDVSRSNIRRVARVARDLQEVNEDVPFLPYVGDSMLRGRIPSLSEEEIDALGLGEGSASPDGGGTALPDPGAGEGLAPGDGGSEGGSSRGQSDGG